MFVPTLIIMLLYRYNTFSMSMDARNSIAMLTVTLVGFINLIALCRPFTKWRVGVCTAVGIGLLAVGFGSVYIGEFLSVIPRDVLYITYAFENTLLLGGILVIAVALSLLLHVFMPNIEAAIYKLVDRKSLKKKLK